MNKKYNRIILFIFALLLASLSVPAYAQSGATCEDPILVGTKYRAQISGAGVKWYVVNTFDLPLTVRYYSHDNMAPPDLYLDFSCTTGVYEDSIICSLFCTDKVGALSLPYHVSPVWKMDAQSNVYYEISMGEWYRNLLLEHGISYNVEVLIKAVYYGAGEIILSPDAEFSECMETEDWLLLGRALPVAAGDEDTYFIAPYANWSGETVRYIWQGEDSATVVMGTTCDFDPLDEMDDRRIDVMGMKAGTDTLKHTSEDIAYYMTYMNNPDNTAKGGIFYIKVLSTGAGTLKVEQEPIPMPDGGATLLQYGETANVFGNDTSRVYAIPSKWTRAMQFTTPTDHVFRMYVGATADFYTKDAFATYQFDKSAEGHVLGLLDADMAYLWTYKVANSYYLYVRFECTESTTILPTLWAPSECVTKSKRIQKGQQFEVARNSNEIYSLYYEEIKGGDMTMEWSSRQTTCPFYIADTCSLSDTNTSRAFYTGSIPKASSTTCLEDVVASWEQYVDPDGYLYILFHPNAKAKITVTTTAPEEEDPPCNTYDSIMTVTAWDSYTWRGTEYTQSGAYTIDGNVDPETGCVDTVFTLSLTIHTTSQDSYSENGCDSIWYNGKKYTQTGVYNDTVFDAGGNRTVMTLNFTINHTTSSDTTDIACDSLFWNGEWYKESGDYTYTTTNAAGCDSTAYLHLTVGHSYEITLPAIKECDSYEWGDTTIYDSGTYTRHFKSLHGCDSIVTLTVTIGQSYLDTKDIITAYDSYTWIDGNTYTSSINGPVWELSTVDDCDSTVSLNLTIRHLVKDTIERALCASEMPYEWHGKFYNESGLYSSDTIFGKAVGGVYMDTVHTVNLTILPLTTGDTTATACESFKWHGKTYTESGDYTFHTTNKAGCDSTVTLYLTIYHATTGDTTATACDSFEWYGQTYEQSGEYNHTFDGGNIHGCDSIVTLHLTINHANSSEETRTEYESYEWNGVTYTESGNYTFETKNAAGCDSTATLHLTIKELPTFSYDTVYFCQGYNTEHEELISETQIRRYRKYRYESPAEWSYRDGLVVATQEHRIQLDLRHVEESLEAYYIGELEPIKKISWIYRKDGETALENLTSTAEPIWKDYGYLTIEVRFICGHVFAETIKAGSTEGVEDIDAVDTSVRKVLQNGQIYLLYNGVMYDVWGRKISD